MSIIQNQQKAFEAILGEQQKQHEAGGEMGFNAEDFNRGLDENPWLYKIYEIIDAGTEYVTESDGTEVLVLEKAQQAEYEAFNFLLEQAEAHGLSVEFNGNSSYVMAEGEKPPITLGFPRPVEGNLDNGGVQIHTKLSQFIHEMIHADDYLQGRYNPSDAESRGRTESKAYAHTYIPVSFEDGALISRAQYALKGYKYSMRNSKN